MSPNIIDPVAWQANRALGKCGVCGRKSAVARCSRCRRPSLHPRPNFRKLIDAAGERAATHEPVGVRPVDKAKAAAEIGPRVKSERARQLATTRAGSRAIADEWKRTVLPPAKRRPSS